MPATVLSLQDFAPGEGQRPDPFAALQRAIIVEAMYAAEYKLIRELCGTTAPNQVFDIIINADALPPSYVACKQGLNYDFIFGGYSDAARMLRAFSGYIAEPWDQDATIKVHADMMHAWQEVRPAIIALVNAAPEGARFRFAGHSFGALVALYAALEVESNLADNHVEYLGLGAPKGVVGMPPPRPDVVVRIATEEDPVAHLPEQSSELVNPLLPAVVASAKNLPWIHLGVGQVLSPSPKLEDFYQHESSAYWLLTLGVEQCFVRHMIDTYVSRLAKVAMSVAGDEYTENAIREILAVHDRIRTRARAKKPGEPAGPGEAVTRDATNRLYYGGQAVIETVEQLTSAGTWELNVMLAQALARAGAFFENALSLREIEMAAPNNAYKVTLSFTTPQEDNWKEIYFCQGDLADIMLKFAPTGPLVTARLKMLNAGYTLLRVRFSALSGSRASTGRAVFASGTSREAGEGYPASTAVIARLASANGAASRHVFLSGISKADVYFLASGRLKVEPSFQTAFTDYVAAMAGSVVRIPYVNKRTEAGFQARAVGFVDGANAPFAVLTVIGGHGIPLPYDPTALKRVILGRFPRKELPGMNGRFDVVEVPDANHLTIRYAVPGEQGVPVDSGTLRIEGYEWGLGPSIANSEIVNLNHRDRKNADSGSRGAQRAGVRRNSR